MAVYMCACMYVICIYVFFVCMPGSFGLCMHVVFHIMSCSRVLGYYQIIAPHSVTILSFAMSILVMMSVVHSLGVQMEPKLVVFPVLITSIRKTK